MQPLTKLLLWSSGTSDRFGLDQAAYMLPTQRAMRILNNSADIEAAIANALRKPIQRRTDFGLYSDDDANSETSSICSERSYSSRRSTAVNLRSAENVAEVLNRCASSSWTERKEGLLGLRNVLRGQHRLGYVLLVHPSISLSFLMMLNNNNCVSHTFVGSVLQYILLQMLRITKSRTICPEAQLDQEQQSLKPPAGTHGL
uniref:Uncharacterized protein n=1 Tax=Eptatretus burgeri TaxID=7764 RepID=A0A8C4Q2F7_EPTBU